MKRIPAAFCHLRLLRLQFDVVLPLLFVILPLVRRAAAPAGDYERAETRHATILHNGLSMYAAGNRPMWLERGPLLISVLVTVNSH